MHIQTDRALVPAGAAATRYLSVTLSAPSAHTRGAGRARPGVDVSLVLDRSGSMGGRKIELARQAVVHAIRVLHADDRVSVVAYDHEVDTVLECMSATPQAKAQALRAVAHIEARGSTDLAEGWFTGACSLGGTSPAGAEPRSAELPFAEHPAAPGQGVGHTGAAGQSDRIRRVLLLTDGLANQGVTDPVALRAAAAHFRAQGIGTTTFGLGNDFDEELLSGVSAAGGGHFYFIEHPQQIPDFFASELGEVLDVVARDVVFEVAAAPGVRVSILNPVPVEQEAAAARVRLGDFVSEQEVTLLVAVDVEPRASGELASVLCRVLDRDAVMVAQPMQVDWTAVPAEEDRLQAVNRDVVLAVARMLAEAARLRALAANRHGGFDEAGAALRQMAAQIAHLGMEDESVAAIAELLVDEEGNFTRHMAARDMKARHMASYAVAYSREPEGKARKRR